MATYILISDNLIRETEVGSNWATALDALWSGDFDGTPKLYRVDFEAGRNDECLNAALIDLAYRAYRDGETPKHLEPLFDKAGLDYPTERPSWTPHPATLGGRQLGVVTGGRV